MTLRYHFYHVGTGVFHDSLVMTDNHEAADAFAKANTPSGHAAILGEFDCLSQRVDVASGSVINYQPPAPSVDHEWHTPTKRWRLNAVGAQKVAGQRSAAVRNAELEASIPRALLDFALGKEGAIARLRYIDSEITAAEAIRSKEQR